MESCAVLILAAGQGTRMRSSLAKVLHPLAGRPLLGHILHTVRQLLPERLVVVVGHQAERVQAAFPDEGILWVFQPEQLGTAHAVSCALPDLAGQQGELLILSGDTPLIELTMLKSLLQWHRQHKNGVTVVSTKLDNPAGYGRIVRDSAGLLQRIVEEKDASAVEKALTEVNSGIYCVDLLRLPHWLQQISANNAQREYYLPDLLALAVREKCAGVVFHEEALSLSGVNDRQQLAVLEKLLRDRLVAQWQSRGVTFIDPSSCWLASDVLIGQDTVIEPNVILGSETVIGEECWIGPFCEIRSSQIGSGCRIKGFCHLEGAVLDGNNEIGPYARLRPGTVLAETARVGNFCELKKAHIGEGSKINHLSYIGDTTMGRNVNVGAGTITCNYDGQHKHKTIIEDSVFIGSDTQLVAPVRIGERAVIGAGTTVTKEVPAEALAVSRTAQTHIAHWHKKRPQ
ncbi:bifunctional UDP-N-acetylglucosamine diphosphorylase/glucosamine-1-phosphate N-acetyltransferase GlmU [Candidatus Magnetaquicoccus inordinatus]|uniref:bifunctional UDP-N-acetylglucosamine diphosphorylase/glucosamine-1-phosphate N-acetyltransferase GlmU n=1 Tax=Candidatus Magnetaquicoccus inordinatus TaxID=2496818 RepID=UPI00102B25FE|nr:bifunctional UDP-N-acetylglucosamine diphosphorylase/glucosamine-1-phosphate N-acetyltransferase GlmU [Candidatus Magnetaquicoccus inordinatus]